MPSGTTFTNELDSCYNEVLALSFKHLPLEITNGVQMDLQPVTTQGDDLVLLAKLSRDLRSPAEIADLLSKGYEAMNMTVNPNKQMISKDKCEYLKRLHLKGLKESYRSYC